MSTSTMAVGTGPRRALTVLLIALVPLATAGPYLGASGIRTEHVYAVVAAIGLLLINGQMSRLTLASWLAILAWAVALTIGLIDILMPTGPSTFPTMEVVLGRFGVPILGILIGAYVWSVRPAGNQARRLSRLSLLDLMLVAVVAVACINTVVALISVADEPPWLELFHPATVESSVGELAAQGGRYGGVLNQPPEAGVFYSTALLAVSRLWLTRVIAVGWFIALAACIGAGGAMSGSKGFLFGGLPVALAYILFSRRPSLATRSVGVGLAVATATLAAWYMLTEFNQPGLDRISSLYVPWNLEAPRSTLFAGRLDSGGKTMHALEYVFREAGPFTLDGLHPGAYDIGVIEFATVAGWVGVAALMLIAVVLLVTSLSGRREAFWVAFAVFMLAANLGGPAFTANRSALVTWVLFGAMLQLHPAARMTSDFDERKVAHDRPLPLRVGAM